MRTPTRHWQRILPLVGVLALATLCAPSIGWSAGSSSSEDDDGGPYEKGVEAVEKGKYEKALSHFQKAYERTPSDPDVLNMLAYTLRKTGEIDKAITHYQKALEIRPEFPEAREYLGEAYLQAAMEQLDTLEKYGASASEEHQELKEALLEAAEKHEE